MKKNHIQVIVSLCALVAIICVACSDKSLDYTSTADEIQVPEDVQVPDAVSTVEKLINDEDILEIPQMDEQALSELQSEAEQATQVPTTDIDIYYVYGVFDEFQVETASVQEDFVAEDVLRKLSLHNIVPVDCKVKEFTEEELEDGTKVLYLELSDSFGDYLKTMSTEAVDSIINSLTNTYLAAFDATELYLSCNGDTVLLSDGTGDPLVWADKPVISK